jgi:sRNA-binding regulator protein Hfq
MAYTEYLQQHKTDKTELKVFLENKTMLTGRISNFDEDTIIIDKCLVFREQIISIKPA